MVLCVHNAYLVKEFQEQCQKKYVKIFFVWCVTIQFIISVYLHWMLHKQSSTQTTNHFRSLCHFQCVCVCVKEGIDISQILTIHSFWERDADLLSFCTSYKYTNIRHVKPSNASLKALTYRFCVLSTDRLRCKYFKLYLPPSYNILYVCIQRCWLKQEGVRKNLATR